MDFDEPLRADRQEIDVVHPLVGVDLRDTCLCTFKNIEKKDAGPIV